MLIMRNRWNLVSVLELRAHNGSQMFCKFESHTKRSLLYSMLKILADVIIFRLLVNKPYLGSKSLILYIYNVLTSI